MTTWADSERDFARWIEQRFPDGGPADERLARADRRRFWSAQPTALAFFVFGVVAVPADQRRLWSPAGPVQAWQLALWTAAGVLAGGALGVAVRRRARDGMWRSWVLEGLTREQRRELEAEVRGWRPVVAGDEAVLRQIARRWVAGGLDLAWAAAFALAVLPAELTQPAGRWPDALRAVVLGWVAIVGVRALVRRHAGAAYLARAGAA